MKHSYTTPIAELLCIAEDDILTISGLDEAGYSATKISFKNMTEIFEE